MRTALNSIVVLLVLVFYSSYLLPTAYSEPWWAEVGNWAKYQVEINLASASENITATLIVRVEITSVDSRGFSARGVVVESRVEPEPRAEDLAKFVGSIEEGFAEEVYVEYSSTPDRPSFYVDPSALPASGAISMEIGATRIEFKYDTETGWLVEGRSMGVVSGKVIIYKMKLLDSNFIGGGGGGSSWLIYATILAIITGSALFYILRRKR